MGACPAPGINSAAGQRDSNRSLFMAREGRWEERAHRQRTVTERSTLGVLFRGTRPGEPGRDPRQAGCLCGTDGILQGRRGSQGTRHPFRAGSQAVLLTTPPENGFPITGGSPPQYTKRSGSPPCHAEQVNRHRFTPPRPRSRDRGPGSRSVELVCRECEVVHAIQRATGSCIGAARQVGIAGPIPIST